MSHHTTILCKVIIYKSGGGQPTLNVLFWPILELHFYFRAFFFISLTFMLINFLVRMLEYEKNKHEKLQADPIQTSKNHKF